MKLIVAAIVVVAYLAIANVSADEAYTTKYDNIDIDEILRSDRLFKNYYNCILDKGSCTPDGRELKNVLPDALKTECSKCNDKQKAAADKVLRFIIDNKPEEWKELQAKYDPEKIYYNKYKDFAAEHGIIL